MSTFEVIMPKMGESVEEATITRWFVSVGDQVNEDDVLLEIATDKVDSEIPSPVAGTIQEIKFEVNSVVPVGKVVAVISLAGSTPSETKPEVEQKAPETKKAETISANEVQETDIQEDDFKNSSKFYSPLVRNIAKTEGLTMAQLDAIAGTGKEGRVTKEDVIKYIKDKPSQVPSQPIAASADVNTKLASKVEAPPVVKANVSVNAGDEIKEMDRMRKLIADHMVMSKQVSAHVTSVVEADVTNIVMWRERVKNEFLAKYGEKITYMPVITEAVARALRDFPGVNSSVDGDKIIYRKNVNVGIAVSLPSGNLIVPVVKQADQKNIAGLAADINRLANEARTNKLSPDSIQGGTFTITNFGSFGNIIGTPIINQPQVAILATGTIEKKPAVIETPTGDVIAIRHKMFLSLSYDHRVVDGALGGSFLRKVADYLEAFDLNAGI